MIPVSSDRRKAKEKRPEEGTEEGKGQENKKKKMKRQDRIIKGKREIRSIRINK